MALAQIESQLGLRIILIKIIISSNSSRHLQESEFGHRDPVAATVVVAQAPAIGRHGESNVVGFERTAGKGQVLTCRLQSDARNYRHRCTVVHPLVRREAHLEARRLVAIAGTPHHQPRQVVAVPEVQLELRPRIAAVAEIVRTARSGRGPGARVAPPGMHHALQFSAVGVADSPEPSMSFPGA